MKHFRTVLGHEIRMLLVNPATYIAAVLFLLVMGFLFARILADYSAGPQELSPGYVFFEFFWLPVLFMVPLLTMRCLAEERRLGTLETLLTTPVTTAEVVLGKFCAAYLLYCGLWAATGAYFYLLKSFARDAHFIDPSAVIGGYAFIAISGLLFVAIGVFTSSFSRNQAVAGILSFVLLFGLTLGLHFLHDAQVLSTFSLLHPVRDVVDYAQVFQHLDDFRHGVVDTRELIFYMSGAIVALLLSILGVEARLLHH